MSSEEVCALCVPTSHKVLWQDDFCQVVWLNDTDYPGYCRVELLSHVKEMTDLPPVERARVMKTVFAVELAIREVLNPDKINLASLGNKTPHIHWHVIPRYESDKHFPNSHWGEAVRHHHTAPELSVEKMDALTQKIKAHIECALNATSH